MPLSSKNFDTLWQADPEVATRSLPQNSKLSQVFNNSLIKCLESGKDGKDVYFTDVRYVISVDMYDY